MGAEPGLLDRARGEVVALPGHQPLGSSRKHVNPMGLLPGWIPPSTFPRPSVLDPKGRSLAGGREGVRAKHRRKTFVGRRVTASVESPTP